MSQGVDFQIRSLCVLKPQIIKSPLIPLKHDLCGVLSDQSNIDVSFEYNKAGK